MRRCPINEIGLSDLNGYIQIKVDGIKDREKVTYLFYPLFSIVSEHKNQQTYKYTNSDN